MDTSREVMRQKKAKPDLAEMDCASTQLVSPEGVPVPMDPSTLMSTLINEADSALRNARPPAPAVNTLRDARYGLRGVRVGEASHPTEAVNQVGEESSWSEVPSTVPATLGAATTWDSDVAKRVPSRRRRLQVVGSGITPTVVDTPVDVHRANRFSPLTAEIDDEPLLGVPQPIGVVTPVRQVGNLDTDSVEFHAIHTPGGSDGSESEDVVPLRRPDDPSDSVERSSSHSSHPSWFRPVLERVDLMTTFRSRACIMKSTPHFLRDASGVGGN